MGANPIWTIKSILLWTTGYFKKHKIESPRLDAELLLAHMLKKKRIYLYTDFEQILNKDELSVFKEHIQKRVNGFSTAAIIGEKEFMGFTLHVNEHVLIPRPDTETWVEKVLQYHRNDSSLFIADLGTGSGAVLAGFLYYCKAARGIGIDISQDALSVAADNGVRLGIEDRVEWRQGNYTDALKTDEVFDGIVSNPPYIPSGDISGLSEEVKHEPRIALDGGHDGLDFYKILGEKASAHLRPGGFLAMEIGAGQKESVIEILKKADWYDHFDIITDYGGVERAIYCRKKLE